MNIIHEKPSPNHNYLRSLEDRTVIIPLVIRAAISYHYDSINDRKIVINNYVSLIVCMEM